MKNLRLILWVALGLAVLVNYSTWVAEFGPRDAAVAAAAQKAAEAEKVNKPLGAAIPQTAPASATPAPAAGTVPATPVATVPAAGTSATPVAGPGVVPATAATPNTSMIGLANASMRTTFMER